MCDRNVSIIYNINVSQPILIKKNKLKRLLYQPMVWSLDSGV